MNRSILREPSALIPLAMSAAALLMVLSQLAFAADPRPKDEGIAAHLFQLLIVAQIPVAAFFAARWLPRQPAQALRVIAMQVFAALVALAPVFIFKL